MFTGMAEEPRRGALGRLAAQRDQDREVIEAWFQGSGATVVTVFAAIAALGVVVVVAQDSPVLGGALAAVLIGTVIAMRRNKD